MYLCLWVFLGIYVYACLFVGIFRCVCSFHLCVSLGVSELSVFVSVCAHLTVSGCVHLSLCGWIWVPGFCPKGLMGKVPLGLGITLSVLMLSDL